MVTDKIPLRSRNPIAAKFCKTALFSAESLANYPMHLIMLIVIGGYHNISAFVTVRPGLFHFGQWSEDMTGKNSMRNRRAELDRQIDSRKEIIKDAAIREFIENGIDRTKISDIARRAEIGEATVYRYFSTKPNLAAECAVKLWHVVMANLIQGIQDKKAEGLDGLTRMREVLLWFGSLHEKHPELLRLLNQLDNYNGQNRFSDELLRQFATEIVAAHSAVMEIVQEGRADGSIRSDFDAGQFYVTAARSILALSQKMLLRDGLETLGGTYTAEPQIQNLIDMQIYFIRGKKR